MSRLAPVRCQPIWKEVNDIETNDDCTQCGLKGNYKKMYWLHDYQGIPCAKVCPGCEERVKARYKSWVFTGYSELDLDEPLEPEY